MHKRRMGCVTVSSEKWETDEDKTLQGVHSSNSTLGISELDETQHHGLVSALHIESYEFG